MNVLHVHPGFSLFMDFNLVASGSHILIYGGGGGGTLSLFKKAPMVGLDSLGIPQGLLLRLLC